MWQFIALDQKGGLLIGLIGRHEVVLELHLVARPGGSQAWWFNQDGQLLVIADTAIA